MPNPKRRHSKARRDKRRAHDALAHAGDVDLPELRRGQAAAPRLPDCGTTAAARSSTVKEPQDA